MTPITHDICTYLFIMIPHVYTKPVNSPLSHFSIFTDNYEPEQPEQATGHGNSATIITVEECSDRKPADAKPTIVIDLSDVSHLSSRRESKMSSSTIDYSRSRRSSKRSSDSHSDNRGSVDEMALAKPITEYLTDVYECGDGKCKGMLPHKLFKGTYFDVM